MKTKSVIDELLDRNVCFAVCVSSTRFVGEEVQRFSKEYFVIINRCDIALMKGYSFYQTQEYRQVYERKLSPEEVEVFKQRMEHFVKVLHSADGRVYELRELPFKAAFDSVRRRTRGRVAGMKTAKH